MNKAMKNQTAGKVVKGWAVILKDGRLQCANRLRSHCLIAHAVNAGSKLIPCMIGWFTYTVKKPRRKKS